MTFWIFSAKSDINFKKKRMSHWIFQKVVMRNKFLTWSGLKLFWNVMPFSLAAISVIHFIEWRVNKTISSHFITSPSWKRAHCVCFSRMRPALCILYKINILVKPRQVKQHQGPNDTGSLRHLFLRLVVHIVALNTQIRIELCWSLQI